MATAWSASVPLHPSPPLVSYLISARIWNQLHVPFHRDIQVLIDGYFGDSDVSIETFILFFICALYVFISLRNLDLSVASSIHAHLPCTTLLNSERNVHYWKSERETSFIGQELLPSLLKPFTSLCELACCWVTVYSLAYIHTIHIIWINVAKNTLIISKLYAEQQLE